jgi:hypothetical protein
MNETAAPPPGAAVSVPDAADGLFPAFRIGGIEPI